MSGLSAAAATPEPSKIKAFVCFTGTGTVAIRDSFNVSSVTDISAGRWEVNFSESMANNDYSASVLTQGRGNYSTTGTIDQTADGADVKEVGKLPVRCSIPVTGAYDNTTIDVIVVGN